MPPSPRVALSAETFGLMARVVHRSGQASAAILRAEGLNPAQFQLPIAVGRASGETQRRFGRQAGVTAGNVSMLVTKLEHAGRWLLVAPVSILAACGASVSAVNLAAMVVAEGWVPPGRPAGATGVAVTLGVGGLASLATAQTAQAGPRTSSVHAATVLWALAGIVVGQRTSSPPVAIAALAGSAAGVTARVRAAAGRRAKPWVR